MGRPAETTQRAQRWLAAALGVDTPFPWQLALLDSMLGNNVPRSLDIPTGLGKTAVMAIWLVARALGAPLGRRLVYVVDRRAVVDQATDVAEGLRELVARTPALREALGIPVARELSISTLRGQFADNREWLADPGSPAIVLGTVDMVGSRLLFEGYGVSRRMRPYQAGLLGSDTLVVVDEAHLVPPFERLVASMCDGSRTFGARDEALRALVPPLRLMSLSATGRSSRDAFGLTPADENDPTVRRRLDAKKRLQIRDPIDPDEVSLPEQLAQEAWRLSASGAESLRCLVYCNSRDHAQQTFAALHRLKGGDKAADKADVELFVGGRRVHERERAATWLRERGFLAGHQARPSKPTFVIATSAGEVGVDLDADHAVCDLVAWERMVQRLGRVNRRGDGEALVVVLPTLPGKKARAALDTLDVERSLEERALAAHQRLLQATRLALAQLPLVDGFHDASPGALRALKRRAQHDTELASLLERSTTPEPLCPALTLPLVEAWAMTSLDEHTGRPEVQPWLRGWIDEPPQTTIVWRQHLPVSTNGEALRSSDVALFFDAAPPHTLELLETEAYTAIEWLTERLDALPERVPAPAPSAAQDDSVSPPAAGEVPPGATKVRPLLKSDVVAFVIPANGGAPQAIAGQYLGDQPAARKRLRDKLGKQLFGSILVVDTRLGGLLDAGLLDAKAPTAQDVAEVRSDSTVRVSTTTVDADRERDPHWREEIRFAIHSTEQGGDDCWLLVESRRDHVARTEEGRSVSRAQLLDEHQSWTERHARALALRLGLPASYVEMLALAARVHDEGKRARRWQRAFKAPNDGVYGKTISRPNIAQLDGYRHELGSLIRVEADARIASLGDELADLCLHLIASHHGFARPILRTNGCEEAPPSALIARARAVALRFTRLQKRWGPWGLVWWEALLRSADQQASRENDEVQHG